MRWIVRRLALFGASLGAAALAAEGAHRLWLSLDGRPYVRQEFEKRMARTVDVTEAFVPGKRSRKQGQAGNFGILHPFFGSEDHPDTGEVLAYFRGGVPEDEYTIVVVGGSVAANWSGDVDREFAGALEADPRFHGRRVRVLRYAHAAYKQPQQVTRLVYLLSFGYRPDAVINLDGFNELASSESNFLGGTNPLYPSVPVWGAVLRDRRDLSVDALDALLALRSARNEVVSFSDWALRWHLQRSSLLAVLIGRRLDALDARSARAQELYLERYRAGIAGAESADASLQRQMHGPPFEGGAAEVRDASVECWFQSSLALRALCAEQSIEYLHCLQPSLFDPGSKKATAEEERIGDGPPGCKAAIVEGYPLLRERGKELVRRGVWFEDLTQCFAGVAETLYFDPCHFHGPGNSILSREIAARFLAHLPATKLAAAPR